MSKTRGKIAVLTLSVVVMIAMMFSPFMTSSVSAKALSKPGKPYILALSDSDTCIKIVWNRVKKANGYEIYRSKKEKSGYSKVKTIKNGATTSWYDSGLKAEETYFYKMKSFKKTNGRIVRSGFSDWDLSVPSSIPYCFTEFSLHHADCTDPTLLTVESLLELREEVKDYVDVQVVAFPQNGLFTDPGAVDLFNRSIEMGVDVVGGAPHLEFTREDGVKDVELVYEAAEKNDKLIDIHIDETGDDHSRFVEVMAKENIVRGFGNRATASHTTAMHNYNNDYAFKLIGNIAKSDLNMITNPFDNSVLQNRLDGYPRRRGHTRVDQMLENGINVAIGHDSIMDPWYSMGKGSMIQAANLLMHTAHMNGAAQIPQLFDMITCLME